MGASDVSRGDRELGKLKGLMLLALPLCIALWPARNVLIVLILHGFVGYSQGIRLASQRPPKLSNGEPVPQILDAASGFLTFLVAACIVYVFVAALNHWLIRVGLLVPYDTKAAQRRWGWSVFWPSLAGLLIAGSLAIVGPGFLWHVFVFFAAAAALFTFVSASQIRHEQRA